MRGLAPVAFVALLLPGCIGSSFQERFDAGLQPAYLQGSPPWRDVGLYDALPDDGEHRGFDVSTGQGPPMTVHSPDGGDVPTLLAFRDADLDEDWGSYQLRLVRWRSPHDDPRLGLAFHLDPESLQGWIGRDVAEAELRARFRSVASSLLDVGHADLDAMEEEFVQSRRDFGTMRSAGSGTAAGIDGVHHIVNYRGATKAEGLFGVLGGLPAFTALPRHQALLLPSPGQVDLVQGPWEFAFDTHLRTATRGPFADTHGLLVTPDDSVLYVHWGEADLSDREAARALADTMRRLGREPPDMQGWTFTRERVEGGPG